MTTKDMAREYQLNQVQLESIIIDNEMPHRSGMGCLIVDDDNLDFLLELYYKKHDEAQKFSIDAYRSAVHDGVVFHIDGARGREIDIYPNKCVITVNVTVGSMLTNNTTDGEKVIYYCDCIGLQFKKPGLTLGYLQFETASSISNNTSNNFFNENTFTYEETHINEHCMKIVVDYVKQQIEAIKTLSMYSVADEIRKYKELLDCGAVTKEEFQKQKERLLGV